MKILVCTPSFAKYSPGAASCLEQNGNIVIRMPAPCRKEDILAEVSDADALIVGLEKVDKDVIAAAQKLKIIAKHGIGVDNIDSKAAREKGIPVTNAPGTNSDAVADLVFGFMLSMARSLPAANASTKEGKWLRYDGVSLWEKNMGIVGMGAIGRAVAKRAQGFAMRVLGFDVTEPTEEEKDLGVIRVSLDQLLRESDFITLHVPLIPATKGMIGDEALQKVKSTAYIVHTSRGGVVDEAALYRALKEGRLAGAGIDVFEKEPPADNPLLKLENVLVTPHMGAFTIESSALTSELTARNVLKALEGEKPLHIVN
ncbi:MAG: phosphoglycerate dehydrogenase [Desulfocucumaceae bacterium]